jgi:hypothetical protein
VGLKESMHYDERMRRIEQKYVEKQKLYSKKVID